MMMTAKTRAQHISRRRSLSRRKADLSLRVAEFVDNRGDFRSYMNASESSRKDIIETYVSDLKSVGIISWFSWWLVRSFVISLLIDLLFGEDT